MEKFIRIIAVAVVIGLGFLAWMFFFPSPEKVIRSRLKDLAETASFAAGDGAISKAYSAQQVPEFFTTNVVLTAEIPGYRTQTVEGRDMILQAVLASRQQLQFLKIEFVDILVTLGEDKETATVNLTAKVTTSRSTGFTPQEFNFLLRKEDGKWLIYRVETVQVLSRSHPNANRNGFPSLPAS